jgi:hypothetical protein
LPSQRRKGVGGVLGGVEESGVWPMTSTVAKVLQIKKEQETSRERKNND